MPNREKWADFVQIGVVSKPHKQHGVWNDEYAQFKCPYQCTEPIELPVSNVKNSKGSKCHLHLTVCTGTSIDGKNARDDPRVCKERKAAVECSVHIMQAAKRCRTSGMTAAVDTTMALREQLECERGRVTTLTASETRLATRNDGLQGRVQDLEAQMEEMRVRDRQRDDRDRQRDIEMQHLRDEMQMLRPLVALVQSITRELGLTATVPPAAPTERYIDCITGLKKAASVAQLTRVKSQAHLDLCADNERLRRERDEYRRERDEHRSFKIDVRKLARDDAAYKHFMVYLHPDKRVRIPPECRDSAEALFAQMLNARKRLPM